MGEFHDSFDRELQVGDVVFLLSFSQVGIVSGFTPKKVKVSHFHQMDKTEPPRVGTTNYDAAKLLILREESFSEVAWGRELAWVRGELGL